MIGESERPGMRAMKIEDWDRTVEVNEILFRPTRQEL
jgi:hypothetical protein